MIKFSIVIPNYNSERWIEKCLNSVLTQTYQNFEIILVDDLSQDNSVQLAQKLLRKKDKLVINKSKRLNGGTRNVGISYATGDYIICIDCDDWLKDDHVLEDINNGLNGEDIMFLGYTCLSKNDKSIDMLVRYDTLTRARDDCICAIWTKCVKRELLQDTPFPEGTLFEDRIQHYRLILKAKTFTNLNRCTYVWNRTNEKNTSDSEGYIAYRFNYCGELYRLIKEIDDEEFKQKLLKELNDYMKSCNKLVGELNG